MISRLNQSATITGERAEDQAWINWDRGTSIAFSGLLAVAMASLALFDEDTAGLLFAGCFVTVLAVLGFIDLGTGRVPNAVVYPAAAFMTLGLALFDLGVVMDSLVGAGAALGLMFLVALIGRGSMGMGDVKFGGLVGLGLGLKLGLAGLAAGFVVGAAVVVVAMGLRLKNRGDSVPLTPFLAVGAVAITLLAGTVAQ